MKGRGVKTPAIIMPPKVERILKIFEKAKTGRTVTLAYGSETGKTGLKGGVSASNAFEIQGYKEQYLFSVWVDADAFTAELVPTKSITVGGVVRRILGTKPDGAGALIRLDLGGRYGS